MTLYKNLQNFHTPVQIHLMYMNVDYNDWLDQYLLLNNVGDDEPAIFNNK